MKKRDKREPLTGFALRMETGAANHKRYLHNGTGHRNPISREEPVERRGWFGRTYTVIVPVTYYVITENERTDLDEIAHRIGNDDRVALVKLDASQIKHSQIVENINAMARGVHEFDLTHDWSGEEIQPVESRGSWSWLLLGGW
jgi:hypothetical protein